MNLFWNDPFSLFDIMHGSVYLCSDLAVELPFMLTHPKPEEPEPIPTPAQRDGTQDGTGKFLTCCQACFSSTLDGANNRIDKIFFCT